jgi:hypothetical protein
VDNDKEGDTHDVHEDEVNDDEDRWTMTTTWTDTNHNDNDEGGYPTTRRTGRGIPQ